MVFASQKKLVGALELEGNRKAVGRGPFSRPSSSSHSLLLYRGPDLGVSTSPMPPAATGGEGPQGLEEGEEGAPNLSYDKGKPEVLN